MAIRVASSNLENFRISGELDELTPSNSNGLVTHVHFEGGLSYYRSLNKVKILCISRYYNSGNNYQSWLEEAGAYIDLIKCESTTEVTEKFLALSYDVYINYDLIIVNNCTWAISSSMIDKARNIIKDGISVFTSGNDTQTHRYSLETINVSTTSETAQYLSMCNDLPFRYEQKDRYLESTDGKHIITKLSSEAVPIIKRDDGNIAAFLVQEEASLFHDNDNSIPQKFILSLCEYLVSRSTSRIKTSNGSNNKMIFTENGVACMNTDNLWDGFNSSIATANYSSSNISDVINLLPNCPFIYNTHDKIIKISPKNGLSYRYIDIDNQNIDTTMTLSAWVFVEYGFNGKDPRLEVEKNNIFKVTNYNMDKVGTWQHISLTASTTTGIFRFLLYVGLSTTDTWTTGNVYFANVKLEKTVHTLEYNPLGNYLSPKITIPLNNIGTSFTSIIKLKRMADYKGTVADGNTMNKRLYNLNSNILKENTEEYKAITYKDYYKGTNSINDPWYAHDDFMSSTDGNYWHWHLGSDFGNYSIDDDEVIIYTKENNTAHAYLFRNNVLYESTQVYSIEDLINFSLDSIDLMPDATSYIRDVFVYNRVLTLNEITKICLPKHLSFTADGDILSKRLIEKPFIDKSIVYFPLSYNTKDYYGMYNANYNDLYFIDNSVATIDSLTNMHPGTDIISSFYISTPIIKHKKNNEVEFTINTSDTAKYRGIKLSSSNIILSASERYEISFEVFSDDEVPLWLDLNSSGVNNITPSNDNYTAVSGSVNFNSIPGKWVQKRILFTMKSDYDTKYKCEDTLIISPSHNITKPITIKIRNICYRTIKDDRICLPYTDKNISNMKLQFNLNKELGLDWSADWTLIFNKKPITTQSGAYDGYCIESLGSNNNSVGGGYFWFGKTSGTSGENMTLRLNAGNNSSNPSTTININKFFNNWHIFVIKKENNTIIYKVFPKNSESITLEVDIEPIIKSDYFVCQNGYDLFLGGFDSNINGVNLYKDLIIAKKALSNEEISKIAKTFLQSKMNFLKVNNELIEKTIL